MRRFKQIVFCSILCSIMGLIAGCSSTYSGMGFLGNNEKVDAALPVVDEVRILADVTSVALEWNLMPNPDNFKGFVLYQLNPNGKAKKIAVVKNSYATHYVINSLIPETRYAFQIATLGKDNAISVKSKIVNAKTSFIDPVETLVASADQPKMIKLIWSPHPNPSIVQYIIQRKSEDGKFLNLTTIKNRLFVEFFDEDLADGKEYSYRIVAQDFNGAKSRISAVAVGKTRNKPQAVENLVASTDLPKDIQLQWDIHSDAQKYEIYVSNALDGRYTLLATTNKNTYLDKIQKDNITRFYKVAAVDRGGVVGELSDIAQGRTLVALPIPHITQGIIRGGQAVIEWDIINNARVKAYAVYRVEGRTKPLRFANMIQNKFVDKEMQRGKKYTYWVVAVDSSDNESAPSQKVELLVQ